MRPRILSTKEKRINSIIMAIVSFFIFTYTLPPKIEVSCLMTLYALVHDLFDGYDNLVKKHTNLLSMKILNDIVMT